jgi:hypothetical protein
VLLDGRFRFDNFVVGDHWDYRAMAPSRLSSNPEPELNELVRRMALGDFDYDILSYDVVERAAYASDHYYYNSVHYDPWCYRCGRYFYGSPFGVSIVFGRPYRRYYYDPYFYAYDPFYNPFFYDPYYYGAAYYPRYVYPRRYYYGWDWYRYNRYPSYNHPYTPYRFRAGDDFRGGYRDRRDDRRSINTVYHPPIGGDRVPAIAAPARRVIGSPETPGAELPSGLAPRRVINDAPRIQGRPAEARRARQAGASGVLLEVRASNVSARALYESLGFSNREGRPDGPISYFYERELAYVRRMGTEFAQRYPKIASRV